MQVIISYVLLVHAVAIEKEHPLIHVEVFNVKLRHKFDNLHAFNLENQVPLTSLHHIKYIDKLIKQMWPKLPEHFSQRALAQPQHEDPRKQEQLNCEFTILTDSFEAFSHLLEQCVQLLLFKHVLLT